MIDTRKGILGVKKIMNVTGFKDVFPNDLPEYRNIEFVIAGSGIGIEVFL